MAAKKRGLGRGLDALLGGSGQATGDEVTVDAASGDAVTSLGVDLVQRGRYQPRRNFDQEKLQELGLA